MPLTGALETLQQAREQRVVVTTMSAAREWPRISDHPLDLNYVPSSMGQGIGIGLGLALARPEREIVVLHGDGATLMNLGSLVTVAASGAANMTVIVVDNGVYEVTGGQRTAGATCGCGVDFAAMARAAGFVTVGTFDNLAVWRAAVAETLQSPGPRFIWWKVAVEHEAFHLTVPGPIRPRLERLRAALVDA